MDSNKFIDDLRLLTVEQRIEIINIITNASLSNKEKIRRLTEIADIFPKKYDDIPIYYIKKIFTFDEILNLNEREIKGLQKFYGAEVTSILISKNLLKYLLLNKIIQRDETPMMMDIPKIINQLFTNSGKDFNKLLKMFENYNINYKSFSNIILAIASINLKVNDVLQNDFINSEFWNFYKKKYSNGNDVKHIEEFSNLLKYYPSLCNTTIANFNIKNVMCIILFKEYCYSLKNNIDFNKRIESFGTTIDKVKLNISLNKQFFFFGQLYVIDDLKKIFELLDKETENKKIKNIISGLTLFKSYIPDEEYSLFVANIKTKLEYYSSVKRIKIKESKKDSKDNSFINIELDKKEKAVNTNSYIKTYVISKKIVSLIQNGINEMDKIRPFDMIDFYKLYDYSQTNVEMKDILNMIASNNPNEYMYLKQKFPEIIRIDDDKKLQGFPVNNDQTLKIANYFRENNIPLTIGTYKSAINRYKDGYILEDNNIKSR